MNEKIIADEGSSNPKFLCIHALDGYETYAIDDVKIGVRPLWISVKDRLPNDDGRVLGTDGKKHEIVCCINSDCEWVGATNYGYLMSLQKVTHWMPLPKLPEVKNDLGS